MKAFTPEMLKQVWSGDGPRRRRSQHHRPDLTPAAVLVPIDFSSGSPHLLLTQRTENVETHKGQIAFPGGMIDSGDGGYLDAALRETEEELGIGPDRIETLGVLDDLDTPTGFIITPVVGLLSAPYVLRANPDEVADVFTVPLSFFFTPDAAKLSFREIQGRRREVWTFLYEDRVIWGATAAIIRNLLEFLAEST